MVAMKDTVQQKISSPRCCRLQAIFKHPTNDAFQLRVPDFSVQPGELVAVVGRVGAGKSSLLQAILGNMDLVRGTGDSISTICHCSRCQAGSWWGVLVPVGASST